MLNFRRRDCRRRAWNSTSCAQPPRRRSAPLIVVSGGLSDKQATECMRLGATDYILRDDLSRPPTRSPRLSTLFDQSAVGISLHEIQRDGLPGEARWNSRMREMLGVVADPDDSSWTSTVTGDEEKDVEEEYSRLLSCEITQLSERRMLTRSDGKKIWADLSTVLVRDRDEQPLRFQPMAEHFLVTTSARCGSSGAPV